MIKRFWFAGRSLAVRRALIRKEKLLKLAAVLEREAEEVERELVDWISTTAHSFDTALDLCLHRALLDISLPWEHKHTDECLDYAAKTGKAFCITKCRDGQLA